MRRGLFLAMILLACSDDGTATTGVDTAGSTSMDPTSPTMSGSGTTSPTGTGDPSTTSEPGTTSDDPGSTGNGSESTSAPDGTSTGSDSGSGSGSSSGGAETSCDLPGVDGSAIGQNCMGVACPEGYDCIDHNGIVLQQLCGILCEEDCNCPDGFTCTEFMDKAGTHYECAQ